MPPLRLKTLVGTPKPLAEVQRLGYAPIGQFRGLWSSSANHVAQIAPGGQPGASKRCMRIPYQPRRGVGTKSSWEQWHRQHGQPKRSNAVGALAIIFGASAIAVLAAPVTTWVKEHVDVKDVDDNLHIDEPDGESLSQ